MAALLKNVKPTTSAVPILLEKKQGFVILNHQVLDISVSVILVSIYLEPYDCAII